MKKYIFPLILLVITISAISLYFYWPKSSNSTNNNSRIEFKEGEIIVQSSDKICSLDADCSIITLDCTDCNFDTINQDKISEYADAKNTYCSINQPKSQCDIEFIGKTKCINKTCQIVVE